MHVIGGQSVDVERHEQEALAGALATIRRCRPAILVETVPETTWIDEHLKEEATFRGYTIVDPATVLTTHLTEILKDNMADLLSYLEMPTEERGITFVNGELSAMPGLQPDMGHILHDGDRVAFFHLKSMWPFQYRHGVPMISEMAEIMHDSGTDLNRWPFTSNRGSATQPQQSQ